MNTKYFGSEGREGSLPNTDILSDMNIIEIWEFFISYHIIHMIRTHLINVRQVSYRTIRTEAADGNIRGERPGEEAPKTPLRLQLKTKTMPA